MNKITRSDSWAAGLDENKQWQLYYKSLECDWVTCLNWGVAEFGMNKPSHTAFYNWRKRMHSNEHAHMLERMAEQQRQIKAVAKKYDIKNEDLIKQLLAAGTDAIVDRHDNTTGSQLINIAMEIFSKEQTNRRLDLQERNTAVLEEKIKIMQEDREKLAETLKKTKLTPEEREKRIREIFGFTDAA